MLTMMDLMEGSHSIRTPENEVRRLAAGLCVVLIEGKMDEMHTSDCAGHAGQWVVDSECKDCESRQGCASK